MFMQYAHIQGHERRLNHKPISTAAKVVSVSLLSTTTLAECSRCLQDLVSFSHLDDCAKLGDDLSSFAECMFRSAAQQNIQLGAY